MISHSESKLNCHKDANCPSIFHGWLIIFPCQIAVKKTQICQLSWKKNQKIPNLLDETSYFPPIFLAFCPQPQFARCHVTGRPPQRSCWVESSAPRPLGPHRPRSACWPRGTWRVGYDDCPLVNVVVDLPILIGCSIINHPWYGVNNG